MGRHDEYLLHGERDYRVLIELDPKTYNVTILREQNEYGPSFNGFPTVRGTGVFDRELYVIRSSYRRSFYNGYLMSVRANRKAGPWDGSAWGYQWDTGVWPNV